MNLIQTLIESDLPVQQIVDLFRNSVGPTREPQYNGLVPVKLHITFVGDSYWVGLATVDKQEIKIKGRYGIQYWKTHSKIPLLSGLK